jgi:hypothetical protein
MTLFLSDGECSFSHAIVTCEQCLLIEKEYFNWGLIKCVIVLLIVSQLNSGQVKFGSRSVMKSVKHKSEVDMWITSPVSPIPHIFDRCDFSTPSFVDSDLNSLDF